MGQEESQSGNDRETGAREISFADFVFLQYQQARYSLGQFPNPETGKYEENLTLAQYAIDVLTMLKQKTQGNLEEPEEKLLENVLHELRITYVERLHAAASRKAAEPTPTSSETPETGPEEGNTRPEEKSETTEDGEDAK